MRTGDDPAFSPLRRRIVIDSPVLQLAGGDHEIIAALYQLRLRAPARLGEIDLVALHEEDVPQDEKGHHGHLRPIAGAPCRCGVNRCCERNVRTWSLRAIIALSASPLPTSFVQSAAGNERECEAGDQKDST
jgi:hypothetical protein